MSRGVYRYGRVSRGQKGSRGGCAALGDGDLFVEE